MLPCWKNACWSRVTPTQRDPEMEVERVGCARRKRIKGILLLILVAASLAVGAESSRAWNLD